MAGVTYGLGQFKAPVDAAAPNTTTPANVIGKAGRKVRVIARKSVGGKAPRIGRRDTRTSTGGLRVHTGGAAPQSPQLSESWYKNPKFSDITINEWFQLSSNEGFLEADAQTIILKDDFPEALEAFFEFCYLGNYTTDVDDHDMDSQTQKSIFLRHGRVLVAADKYMAEELVECAVDKLRATLADEIEDAASFFKSVVEQVYLHPEVFGLELSATQDTTRTKQPKSQDLDTNVQDGLDETSSNDGLGSQDEHEHEVDVDGFNSRDLAAVFKPTTPIHPLDRLKQLVVKATVTLWVEDGAEIGCEDLAFLVQQLPDFGADLAYEALGVGLTDII